MLKRINWSAIFTGFAWLISLAGVVVLLSFINVKKQTVKCTDVKILIPGADNFIEREEIDAILKEDQGVLLGRNLENINIHKIEKKLQSNPYIGFAKVYVDMDGVLHIEVKQRQPILRILNENGQDFYIDNDGLKMPISSNFTANVLVATGHITEVFGSRVDTLHTQLARDLYKTAQYIKQDTLWDAQIEQIVVDQKNDIELIPRVGNQRIVLGNADSLEKKMKNLLLFYKKAMPQVGWDTYKTINIKYTNQIVCEKRDSTELGKKAKTISAADSLRIQRNVTDSLINSTIVAAMDDRPEADEAEKVTPKREAPKKPEAKKIEPKKVEVTKIEAKKPEPKKAEVKKEASKKTVPVKTEVKKSAVAQAAKPKETKPADKKEKPKQTVTTQPKPAKSEAQLKKEKEAREREIRALEKQYKTQQN
ncbi:cell division protein FtsQ [Pedobacter sp. ISL-68]|uniref:cell division protein FtsQ/DivIB n=1 Tax=unclassified Pedobacter TaxID=2628915 RepID=UPI001BE97290|nr:MULTISPECIES: cell division protein FtsQ [unclassified Pedobacter]MBT2562848.1 cell division protein FtsQ [Pedobacter sp. ISL-64]MBT2593361.1 cell division protein FtsQ [Pedobacter sp. ISL-68]